MLADGHRASGERVPETGFVQLQITILENDRVVVSHRSLRLDREHPVQVLAPAFAERCSFLSCRLGELAIELADVALTQERVCLFPCADTSQPELLRQPVLPSAKIPFTPASRLRRIRWDHLYPEFSHSPSHLRQPVRIDLLAGPAGHKEVARAIAV